MPQRNEKHQGSHDIVHVKDKTGQVWATRGVSVLTPFPAPSNALLTRWCGTAARAFNARVMLVRDPGSSGSWWPHLMTVGAGWDYGADVDTDTECWRVQSNVFVIGHKQAPLVTLPKQKGIKHSIIEEARRRAEKAAKN